MRGFALVLVGLMIAAPAAGALTLNVTLATGGEVIVGYREGALSQATQAVVALGGTVLSKNEDLRFLVVETKTLTSFLGGIVLSLAVEYAEENDETRLDGAQWNGAQWNGAQWNGAQWNGAQWNGAPSEPGTQWQWGLPRIGASTAWKETTGERGATLCVLDSGVDLDHPDLKANLWTGPDGSRGFNAIDPGASPDDDGGHGTHVAGIAAAQIGNRFGVAGVGNVRIVPVKVLGADGTGEEDELAAGLVWCANKGFDVALMALGVDDEGPTVRNALRYAAARDMLLVASAGNGGCSDCVGYPASDKNVVAVGAIDVGDRVASFSSRGSDVELAAPGVGILSTFMGGEYRYGSGTSQAAGFVAGAAALLRDAEPTLTASEARDRLTRTADDIGAAGRDASTGYGVVDIGAALAG